MIVVISYLLKIQVRDLLLWQDVYMGEAGGAGGASQVIKDVISSQNGSQDGSDGVNELAEEMDKLQVGKDYFWLRQELKKSHCACVRPSVRFKFV